MVTFAAPDIRIQKLPSTGARDTFQVEVVGPDDTSYVFPLSISYTALAIWQEDSAVAASELAATLVESHGTAQALPDGGFWFDSYLSGETLKATTDRVREHGWRHFLTPADRHSLGAALFETLDDLDRISTRLRGQPFVRPLDILFEPSQALEDLESEVPDHAHFMYRICILSGVVDRFNFGESGQTLNGLRVWLSERIGDKEASALTEPFRMLKRLRRQYPIHENFEENTKRERQRRKEIVEAECYFGLDGEPRSDWSRVFGHFVEATREIRNAMRSL